MTAASSNTEGTMAAEEIIASPTTTAPDVASATEVVADIASTSPAVTGDATSSAVIVPTESISVVESEPVKIETLLNPQADKLTENVVDIKPAEKTAESKDSVTDKVADKVDEASQSEEAPLPTYELKLPDEVKFLEPEGPTKFTSLLGEYEKKVMADPKSIHTAFQELGQEMMNRHIAEVQNLTAKLKTDQATQTEEAKSAQLKSWKEEVEKDSVYGGNRLETTINAAEKAIKTYGGDAKEQQEFRDVLMSTGLINNKAMIRMLANVTSARPSPVPLAAKAPASQAVGMMQKRYGRPNR